MIDSYDVYILLKPSGLDEGIIGKDERVVPRRLPLIALAPGYKTPPELYIKKYSNYPTSQLVIAMGIDWILENRKVDVVNLSIGWAGAFDPTDPVQIATRCLYESDMVVVIATGNHGPKPDTMQALAKAPWVISVGATDDRMKLLECSGRGIQDKMGPTVVSSGIDTMPDPFPPSTSIAAPRAAGSIAWLRASLRLMSAQLVDVLNPEQTNFILDPPITRPVLGILDTGMDPKYWVESKQDRVYILPTEHEGKWFQEFYARIPEAFSDIKDNPDVIRRAVEIAAHKMPEYKYHEVGAGYLDDEQVSRFLSNITPSRWCKVFCPQIIEDGNFKAILSILDNELGSLWTDIVVQITKDIFRNETSLVIVKVV